MNGELPSRITNAHALLVEGKDEDNFFKALVKHLSISDVLTIPVGGIRQFPTKYPAALLLPGFRESVKSYAIIRDADRDAEATFQSVKGLIGKYRQPCPQTRGAYAPGPPKVGVYIMPGNAATGMLENLCMDTVEGHPIIGCVNTFMTGINNLVQWIDPATVDKPPNNPHKARAKCFLAGNERDLPSIGVAAQAGVWNFDHESMRSLREFISQLVTP